jgi:histidinol phosphatase-like enzyme (inositol monophosphatase family)
MDYRFFLQRTARPAGEIALQYFNATSLASLAVTMKSDATPVTEADRATEKYIREGIRRDFPDDVIVGEEFGTDGSNEQRRWIIDPIDGTKSFIHGVPLWGVMIALEQAGKITHGVVHFPALGETVSAGVGEGCFLNRLRVKASAISTIEESTLLATNMQRLEQTLSKKAYSELTGRVALTRGWGDCYGHILVATGRAEIMIDPKMAIWDAAPLGVIVEEAGGRSFDLAGNKTIDGGSLVSCAGGVADEVLRILTGSSDNNA